MTEYRSVFISDLNLGTKISNAAALLEFFKTFETDKIRIGAARQDVYLRSHADPVD